MSEPKPIACPFCTAEAGVMVDKWLRQPAAGEVFGKFYVECQMCGTRGPYSITDEATAIQFWNNLFEELGHAITYQTR